MRERRADIANTERFIGEFEAQNQLILPDDLKAYFKSFRAEKYDTDIFFFYGIDEFKSVKDTVGDFEKAPDYRNIVNTLPEHRNCFVFAEYFIKVCVYAIRLYKDKSERNEIYVIMGDDSKVIANSFSEYLDIYRTDTDDLLVLSGVYESKKNKNPLNPGSDNNPPKTAYKHSRNG